MRCATEVFCFKSNVTFIICYYFNVNRTYQNFRSWISCADPRRGNGPRTGWDCWLHGYVKYPLLVMFY